MKELLNETALRQAILTKAGIKLPALSNRVKAIKDKDGSISGRLALGIVAQKAGLHLEAYFEASELKEIRGLVSRAEPVKPQKSRIPKPTKKLGPRKVIISLPDGGVFHDPLLESTVINEAKVMAEVYPKLYVFENSIRAIIQNVMETKYGLDWWDTQLTSGRGRTVKNEAESRMQTETQKLRWHQKRGAHPIFYTMFEDLEKLIFAKRGDFFPEPLGEDEDFIKRVFKQISPSRNVTCHMNPLDDTHKQELEVICSQWQNIIKKYSEENS